MLVAFSATGVASAFSLKIFLANISYSELHVSVISLFPKWSVSPVLLLSSIVLHGSSKTHLFWLPVIQAMVGPGLISTLQIIISNSANRPQLDPKS